MESRYKRLKYKIYKPNEQNLHKNPTTHKNSEKASKNSNIYLLVNKISSNVTNVLFESNIKNTLEILNSTINKK